MKHLGKFGFVKLLGVMVLMFLLFGPLVLTTVGEYLQALYHLFARRYERTLDDAYSLSFQTRATEARILNANVGYALRRAKRTVEEARRSSTDELQVRAALGQVSEWLDSAAETSDRALRSLEGEPKQARESHGGIFTNDDLDA